MQTFKRKIAAVLAPHAGLTEEKLAAALETPPDAAMGDLAFPCFALAKTLRKAPQAIAADLAPHVRGLDFVEEVQVAGAYLNVRLSARAVASEVLPRIRRDGIAYGSQPARGERVVVDYSSPNIAKPFSIGHLRSTMVGHALVEHLKHLGYETVGVNHLGDWGTQFGMVMAGFKLWGDRPLERVDVRYLLDIYVRFNKEAKDDKALEELAREWFRKLEGGDAEARKLWEVFREVSLEEARRIYARLGVEFQHYTGESFYNDRLSDTIARLKQAGLLVESQGAQVVDLEAHKLPPCLIQKSDGATLYATRDLSAAIYRVETFQPARVLYVVGAPQKLHFQQFFLVLEKLDPAWAGKFVHVDFGHYRLAEGKMATRTGNVVFMEDVLDRGVEMARQIMEQAQRGGDLEEGQDAQVCEQVALGAIVFGDLSNDRVKDVVFDWEKALDFKGDTGPYVQYTRARIASILRKGGVEAPESADWSQLSTPEEKAVMMLLLKFPQTVEAAAAALKPSFTANYALDLARAFGRFYNLHPVLKSEPAVRDARLCLSAAVGTVLAIALRLLGIPVPERM
ncbi:MAG: arginine--tRNA ligase [Candidatus Wallbacteria bacterium]|nr:arginine--tRNA ligase [Candidatus Wallbacteria bacterium]